MFLVCFSSLITGEVIRIRINPQDYQDKLVDYSMVKVYAIGTVKETQQVWSEEDDFTFEKPNLLLNVRGDSEIHVGREFNLEIKFTNPLSRSLTDVSFTIEGPGLMHPIRIPFRDIQPHESIVHVERFNPQKTGSRKIVVVFHSRQLIDVIGSKSVQVY